MGGLVNMEFVKILVVAVLLMASAASQPDMEFVTNNSRVEVPLPSSPPALTQIKFSVETNTPETQACLIYPSRIPEFENFTVRQDNEERNTIAVLYSWRSLSYQSRSIWNLLTNSTKVISVGITHLSLWSEHPVRWRVFHSDPRIMNTTTAYSSTTHTALLSPSPSPYLSPAVIALAILCLLLAVSTLVLSILHCQRCASPRSGLRQAASSTDSITFKSTETLVTKQAYCLYNQNDRGSLHVSENSLYGVI